MKTCACCKQFKNTTEFNKQSCTKDGFRTHCRDCQKQKQAVYRKNNQNLINLRERTNPKTKIRDKQRYLKNKVKVAERQKLYFQKTKHIRNLKTKEKRQLDVSFKLAGNLRARLRQALKKNQKAGSAVSDLGCSIDFLKNYLETLFRPGMTWNNYGKNGWHIDHIMPLSKFNLTNKEEFLKACHYTNLQPLWAADNISKSNKLQKCTAQCALYGEY